MRSSSSVACALVFVCGIFVARAGDAAPPDLELQEVARAGLLPRDAVLSPDGRRFYVASSGALDARNVSVLDAATLREIATLDVPGTPTACAVSAGAPNWLYVANDQRDAVQVIDVPSRQTVKSFRFPVGTRPKGIVASADGKTVFTANWGNATVSQIDAEHGWEIRHVSTARAPRGIALAKTGALYVASFTEGTVHELDTANELRERRRIDACEVPRDIALSPDERTLYVLCYRDWEVRAIDLATARATHAARVGTSPRSLAVSADGLWVWTADYGSASTVTVIDTRDWTTRTMPVPGMDRGAAIALARDGEHALVTGWYDGHAYLVGFSGTGGHPEQAMRSVQSWIRAPRVDDPAP